MFCTAGNHCTLNKILNLKRNCIHTFWIRGKLHFRLPLVPVKFSLLLTHLLQLIWGEGSVRSLKFGLSLKALCCLAVVRRLPQLRSAPGKTLDCWKAVSFLRALPYQQSHQRKGHQAWQVGSYLYLDVSWPVLGVICTMQPPVAGLRDKGSPDASFQMSVSSLCSLSQFYVILISNINLRQASLWARLEPNK